MSAIKLIDFEFLHRYAERPATFADSYDIAGCPADFPGDQPAGGAKNYRRHWLPYTGLSLQSLLHDPAWLQHFKRTVYVATHAYRYWPRRLRHVARQLLARSRGSALKAPQHSPALISDRQPTRRAA